MVLVRNWWALALRGVFAVVFGVTAFIVPGITLAVLVALFGAYALIDGIFTIVAGVRAAERHERWTLLIVRGLAGVVAGGLAFLWPAATALALLYLISAWAVITGILEIAAAVHLHRAHGEWLLILNGLLSVLFGVFLIALPGVGLITLVWWIGAWALFFGVVLLALAFRLRRLHLAHPRV